MALGLHPGLPFLVMSHPSGSRRKTGSSSPDLEKPRQPQPASQRSDSTCPEKEHFPGQELTWGSSLGPRSGRPVMSGWELRAPRQRQNQEGWKKTEGLEEKGK